jgi:hypothetical protein
MTSSRTEQNSSISILMPVFQPNPDWLKAAIRSLTVQTHHHWQLVLSLDGDDPATRAAADIARTTLTPDHKLVVVEGERSGITGYCGSSRAAGHCNTISCCHTPAVTRYRIAWSPIRFG